MRTPSIHERRAAVGELCTHIMMTSLRRIVTSNHVYGALRDRGSVVRSSLLAAAWPELFVLQFARWPLDALTLVSLAHSGDQIVAETTVILAELRNPYISTTDITHTHTHTHKHIYIYIYIYIYRNTEYLKLLIFHDLFEGSIGIIGIHTECGSTVARGVYVTLNFALWIQQLYETRNL